MSNFEVNSLFEKSFLFIDGEKFNIQTEGIDTYVQLNTVYYEFEAIVNTDKDINKLFSLYSGYSTNFKQPKKCLVSYYEEGEGVVASLESIRFVNEIQKSISSDLSGQTFSTAKIGYEKVELKIRIVADKNGNIKKEKIKTTIEIKQRELEKEIEKIERDKKEKKKKAEIEKNKKNKFRLIRFN